MKPAYINYEALALKEGHTLCAQERNELMSLAIMQFRHFTELYAVYKAPECGCEAPILIDRYPLERTVITQCDGHGKGSSKAYVEANLVQPYRFYSRVWGHLSEKQFLESVFDPYSRQASYLKELHKEISNKKESE